MKFLLTFIFVFLMMIGSVHSAYVPNTATISDIATAMSTNIQARKMPTVFGYRGVAYGNGTYCAVAAGTPAAGLVASSPDGENWVTRTAASARLWKSIAYGAGKFVAIASDATAGGEFMTSTDCITWTSRTDANLRLVDDIIWNSTLNLFVLVGVSPGGGGASHKVATSPDGITWTGRTSAISGGCRKITVNELGVMIATAGETVYGPGSVQRSTDGINWTQINQGVIGNEKFFTASWNGLSGANSKFMIITSDGYAATSPDGLLWTYQGNMIGITGDDADSVTDVIWNGYSWIAVGKNMINVSSTGKFWSLKSFNYVMTPSKLLFMNKRILGVNRIPPASSDLGAFTSLNF